MGLIDLLLSYVNFERYGPCYELSEKSDLPVTGTKNSAELDSKSVFLLTNEGLGSRMSTVNISS